MYQVNTEVSQSIKVNSLFKIPEEKPNNGNQSDDDKFGSLRTLEESIFLVLRQWQLDDTNNLVQIPTVQLVDIDCIYSSSLFFCPKTFFPLIQD